MAVYEGARPRPILVPPRAGRAVDVPAVPRRRMRGAVRARRRSNRIGVILGVIVLAFLAAFFSLAQTMRVSATGYEVDRLLSERDRLDARQRELVADLNRLGREPAIRKLAIDLGLGQLGEPLLVPAR